MIRSLKHRENGAWIILLGSVSFLWVIYLLYSLRYATPIADDYCFAQLSKRGVLLGTLDQFISWDGNYTLTFLTVLLVGAPLIAFGPHLGSAFPIYLMTIMLFFLFYRISKVVVRNGGKKHLFSFMVALSILGSWHVFWLSFKKSPSFVGTNFNANFAMFSDGFLHWKTLQISYLLMFFIVCLVTFFSWRQICTERFSPVLFLLGLILGGSSYILAGTSFLIIQYRLLGRNRVFFKKYFKNNFGFSFTLAIGLLLNYFSPGAQRRKDVLDLALAPTRSFSESLIKTLEYLLNSFFSIGFIFMILCGLSLAPYLSKQFSAHIVIKHFPSVYFFLSVLTTIGCYFAGSSPWRYSHLFILAWILGLLVGVYLYQNYFVWGTMTWAIATSMIISVFFYGASMGIMNRYSSFMQGASPISGIEDIESAWVRDCAIASNLDRS